MQKPPREKSGMAFTSWNPSRSLLNAGFFLLLALSALTAATTQEVSIRSPELLYSDDPGLDAEVLRDVILRELSRQLEEDGRSPEVLPRDAGLNDARTETVLVPEFGIAEGRLYLSLTVRTRDTGATVGGAAGQSALDVGVFNQVSRLYRSIRPSLEEAIAEAGRPPAERGSVAPEILTSLRLESPQDEVEVRRLGGEVLGVTENGVIEVDYLVLGPSDELPLRLSRRGFYPRELTIQVDPDRGQTIELPALTRATRTATYLLWSPQQVLGLGLGGRYYLQPDLSFFQAEGVFNLQKDFDSDAGGSSTHVDARLSGGRYLLFDYASWFRFSLEAALGLIYSGFPGRDFDAYWDPYVTPLALSLEANGTHISIFARFESRFALGGSRAVFEPGFIEVSGQDLPIIATIGVLSKW